MDDRTHTSLTPDQLAGAVLSGGKSTRMGEDKALLTLGNRTLLEHAVARLHPFCKERMILSNHPTHDLPGIPRYPDQIKSCGPMSGLLTAFAASEAEYLLVLAVDIPMISFALLEYLIKQTDTESKAFVPISEGRMQPLCAVYSRKFLPDLEAAFKAGTYGLTRLLKTSAIKEIPLGPEQDFYFPELFLNVNRPEDWAQIQQRWSHEG